LVTYWALMQEGRDFGLPQGSWEKVSAVLDGGMAALRRAVDGGVNVVFGSDLLGGMHRHQAREFAIRAEAMSAIDVIRSATVTAARLLQCDGELGVIAPGAAGDFVVTDADPLLDIGVLAETRLDAVIQAGAIVKTY